MKFYVIIFVLAACTSIMSHAQIDAGARTSSNFFGEGTAASQDAALGIAKNDFIAKIKPAMRNDVQIRKLDDVTCWKIANLAMVYTDQRGSSFTVVITLPKNELRRAYAEAVMFDVLPEDDLDEFGIPRDKQYAESATDQGQVQNQTQVQGQVQNQTQVQEQVQNQTQVQHQDQVRNQVQIAENQPLPVTSENFPTPPVGKPAPTGNALLDEILGAYNIFELSDFFLKERNRGSLAYGMSNTMTTPGNSYLIYYQNDGTIAAVYDKGSENRKNLLTGATENHITKYRNFRYLWFQLYQ